LQVTSTGNGEVSLSWCPPIADRQHERFSGYNVYRGTSSDPTALTLAESTPDTTYTATNLTNGTRYYFEVLATYAKGPPITSNQVEAVPQGPPGAPTGLMARAGDSGVDLSWTAPSGGSPVTGYKVYDRASGGGSWAWATTAKTTSATVPGLVNGTTYDFVVTAVNASGESRFSNMASATPSAGSTGPGAPADLRASAGDSGVDLSWTAPSGGSQVTGYKVYMGMSPLGESRNAVATTTGTAGTSVTVRRLANGTRYYFVVRAVNAIGEGPDSTEASATPRAGGSISALDLSLIAVGIAALVGVALAVRRWRLPRQPSVRIEPHAGQPARVAVHSTGSRPTVTVRIEPHPGAAQTKIEEMR
jgi:hypothetical protein